MASEVCIDKSMCKIWTAGSPAKKKEWAVMVIALFTSDFPTMQLCDHHILKHKPTPESSTDPAHQYIETGWKDQKLQRQYKIGQTYVVTMTS